MKQLERHKEYSEMLIHCFCFSLDGLSILQSLCINSICVCMCVCLPGSYSSGQAKTQFSQMHTKADVGKCHHEALKSKL